MRATGVAQQFYHETESDIWYLIPEAQEQLRNGDQHGGG